MTYTGATDDRPYLFLQSTTDIGGAETALMNLLEGSPELRKKSLVAILGFGDGDLPQRLRSLGAMVVELRPARLRHPVRVASTVIRVSRIAREHRAKALVANGSHPQVIGGLAARIAKTKSVFYVHDIFRTPLVTNHPIAIAAILGPCDLYLANSRASLSAIERLRPGNPAQLMYPGVPQRTVGAAAIGSRRSELRASPGDVLFGVFGRLQHWKGQDIFLKAAMQVAREIPRSRFVIVGGSVFGLEPDFRTDLGRTIERNGLSERIVMTGFRTDVAELMAACDVVCHTSRAPEPFGMVIVEAMMQGRAVVATRGGGPEEIIQDGETGLLVRPEEVDDLARAMRRLALDADLRRALGEGGLQRVGSRFSSAAAAARLQAALEAV